MDNQQATAFDMGWLIGAIDGEGSIGLSRCNRYTKAGSGFRLKPNISISNCDYSFIERCDRIMRPLRCGHYICAHKGHGRRRDSWFILVQGLKRVDKFLPFIAEHLCKEKREKARLLQEYVTSRLADWHAAPFTPRQLEIYSLLAGLNTKGREAQSLRDYTRSSRSSKFPNGTRDEDIVQSATKDAG